MTDPASEASKATQEIAKATSKGIDAGCALGEFLARYIGGPLEQASGIVEDKLRYMRWERQVRLIERAEEFLKERGLDAPTRRVPLKIAIPLFQAASMEESDELQDLWARLLANAADAESEVEVTRGLVSVVQDFGPIEARVLQSIYNAPSEFSPRGNVATEALPDGYSHESDDTALQLPRKDVQIALWHLKRLGCIDSADTWDGGTGIRRVKLTELGRTLIRACTNS